MSIKIKVKKRINENSKSKYQWNGWSKLFEDDATAATDANATTAPATGTQPADTNTTATPAANQAAPAAPQGQQPAQLQGQQPTNTQQQGLQPAADASTANGPDVNKFVKEVLDFYIKLCTGFKETFNPTNLKTALPTYEALKAADLYKGKELAFAKAVNDFTAVDPKDYQKAMPAFSKIIEELGKYVSEIAKVTPGENVKPVTGQPAPALTQGQTETTTTTSPLVNNGQQPAAPAAQ